MTDDTIITYSVPGNIVLMGEHAILHGHPCLACAIDRRMTVRVTPLDEDTIFIDSDLGQFRFPLSEIRDLSIHDQPADARFVLAGIQQNPPSHGIRLTIDSDIPPNFGLSSSAAVTVGTVACMRKLNDNSIDLNSSLNGRHIKKELFDACYDVVYNVQRKKGSGYDLAASIWGGIIRYDRSPFDVIHLPVDNLPISLLYSGYKTLTTKVIDIINQRELAQGTDFQPLYQQMGDLVDQAVSAIHDQNWPALGQFFNQNHRVLSKLGVNDDTLNHLVEWANNHDALGAKTSGAGLGDCAVALFAPDQEIPDYPDNDHGIKSLDVRVEQTGLRCH